MRGEEGATEGVGERETEVEEVGLADDAERRHRGGLVGQRGVGEPHASQQPVAGGLVDDRGQPLPAYGVQALGDHARLGLQLLRSEPQQSLEREHPLVGVVAVDLHDLGDVADPRPDPPQGADRLVVLGDHDARPGVLQHVGHLGVIRGRVDERHRGPAELDRQERQHPLVAGRRHHRDPLLGLDLQRDQPGGEPLDQRVGLLPGRLLPATVDRVVVRLGVGRGLHPLAEHVGEGTRALVDHHGVEGHPNAPPLGVGPSIPADDGRRADGAAGVSPEPPW